LWSQFKIILLVILGWISTFLLLEKKKFSLFSTVLAAGTAALLFFFYDSPAALFNLQNFLNFRLLIEEMGGAFVIFFITMFLFSATIQLISAAFLWTFSRVWKNNLF
jgi:hypothetical protein